MNESSLQWGASDHGPVSKGLIIWSKVQKNAEEMSRFIFTQTGPPVYNARWTMRVVGGIAKGKRLKGATISGARPTSELVRGAIFNVLSTLDHEPTRALDLYAGTGSLGIEALSRGAGWVDFVERNPRQCAATKENLENTGLTDRARVYCMDVMKALTVLEGGYQLALMDPPYKLTSLDEVLDTLGESGLLEEGATVVAGHSKRLPLKDSYNSLGHVRSYRYGDSAVDFFERGAW